MGTDDAASLKADAHADDLAAGAARPAGYKRVAERLGIDLQLTVTHFRLLVHFASPWSRR
jgi:hypothetical protein